MAAVAETLLSISVTKATTDEGMHVENQYKLQGSKYGGMMERVKTNVVVRLSIAVLAPTEQQLLLVH